jgi:hypothetical protein
LPMSTRGLIAGTSPCFERRRSSDSIADRCWVGFTPNRENARRQAATDGIPAIAILPSRSMVTDCWERYSSSSAAGLPGAMSTTRMAAARIVGNASMIAGSYRKNGVSEVAWLATLPDSSRERAKSQQPTANSRQPTGDSHEPSFARRTLYLVSRCEAKGRHHRCLDSNAAGLRSGPILIAYRVPGSSGWRSRPSATMPPCA